jgi:hypothetical protein
MKTMFTGKGGGPKLYLLMAVLGAVCGLTVFPAVAEAKDY